MTQTIKEEEEEEDQDFLKDNQHYKYQYETKEMSKLWEQFQISSQVIELKQKTSLIQFKHTYASMKTLQDLTPQKRKLPSPSPFLKDPK